METSIPKSARRRLAGASLAALVLAAGLAPAAADEADARRLLQAMSDYMGAQQRISFSYDTTLEAVTTDLQKLDFASSGTVSLSRPDKLRVTRTGGFADVAMVYDGQTFSVLGKTIERYAQLPVPGTIDQLIDHLRLNFGVEAPGADLLLANVADVLMEPVIDVKDLGSGVVNGVECNHLAFRTAAVDWQIWISLGDDPHPCRYVITSKLVALAPEYRVDVRDWKAGDAVAADDFAFDPGTATLARPGELQGLDELPDLTSMGEAQ